ncbi:HVA22-like protein k [Linum perenne]
MEFPTEVGLQLIRYPLNSKLVLRTACCSVGIAMPVYSTFKAIERDDRDEQKKCLVYWSAFGAFSVAEVFTDKILSWFPMYYHVKFAFLIWLQLPSTNGSACLYWNYLRPFLLRHQVRLDHIAEVLNSIMVRPVFLEPRIDCLSTLLLRSRLHPFPRFLCRLDSSLPVKKISTLRK